MRMLRITGCSNSSYWYEGKIGEVVKHLGLESGEYITREPSGFVNIIKEGDAEVVDVVPVAPPSPSIEPEAPAEKRCYLLRIEVGFPAGLTVALANSLRFELEERAAQWARNGGLKCTFGD